MEDVSSRLLDDAIREFATLPGIGKKTATRLVLHLLRQEKELVHQFGTSIIRLRNEIQYCAQCHNISDHVLCNICNDKSRDSAIICVVEDLKDILAIEYTQQYRGLYHVLGGKISPMEGIGPSDLHIDSLLKRIQSEQTQEVILALSTTMEGDTTNFYLYKKLTPFSIQVTTIARGISFGDELEYADEVTLERSILHRLPYEKTLSR